MNVKTPEQKAKEETKNEIQGETQEALYEYL